MVFDNTLAAIRAALAIGEDRAPLVDLLSLKGKTALVTGGAGPGLGTAVVDRLASLGANVVVVDLDVKNASEVAAGLSAKYGVKSLGLSGDVTDPESVDKVVAAAMAEFGYVDVLVNSVGASLPKPFIEHSPADISKMISINLLGMLYMSRACAEKMMERGGNIVNVSSTAASEPWMGSAVYGAAKAGINSATRYLSWELSKYGIRVNSVAPAFMASERHVALLEKDDDGNQAGWSAMLDAAIANTPLGRPSNPVEVADAIAFLASDASSYVQGAIWNVSGGVG